MHRGSTPAFVKHDQRLERGVFIDACILKGIESSFRTRGEV
jgi:hypothetical protein